jgi:AraC-like DNA-binding protein
MPIRSVTVRNRLRPLSTSCWSITRLTSGCSFVAAGQGRQHDSSAGVLPLAEIGPDPTLTVLPHIVRLEAGAIEATGWLAPLFTLIDSEASTNEPGSRAVLAKIADVLLTQALRAWLVGAERAGLLMTAPLRDSAIATALQAIRERPAACWSLDRLARQAGLSRTAFATRFRTLVGEPPMRYVTKARLSLAAGYLATSRIPIQEIAVLAGYNDEASLSKAFRREFGRPPGEYRAASRRPPPITVAGVGALEDGSVAPS